MALKNSVISDFVAKTSERNIQPDIHDISEVHDEHEVNDKQDVHEEYEVHDVLDAQDTYEENTIENSSNKAIQKDNHEVYDDNIILTIAKLVNEVQKVQQVHEVHDVQEVQYAQTYETTRGKKGKQLHRMNTGYTQPNWEFLTKESRRQGLRGGATELINLMIDEYRNRKK